MHQHEETVRTFFSSFGNPEPEKIVLPIISPEIIIRLVGEHTRAYSTLPTS